MACDGLGMRLANGPPTHLVVWGRRGVGIDTLCRHNFEHNRYIWEFENNVRIIGRNSGIGISFSQDYPQRACAVRVTGLVSLVPILSSLGTRLGTN